MHVIEAFGVAIFQMPFLYGYDIHGEYSLTTAQIVMAYRSAIKQIINFSIDYYHTGIGQGIDCCS